jgi:lactobin A/cerein 7B family class IIb bacteriocin
MKILTFQDTEQISGGFSPLLSNSIVGGVFLAGYYVLYATYFVDFNIKDAIGYGVVGAMLGAMGTTFLQQN